MVSKSGKITRAITIDAALDAQMKRASGVNWSAVASAAFEQELLSRKRSRTMASVIERLRASRKVSVNEHRVAGVAAGQEWAKHTAGYDELQVLGESQPALHNESGGAADQFVFTFHPELNGDTQAAARFWEFALDEDLVDQAMMEDDDFVRGFYEGAVAVWNEVKDQI